MSSHITYEPANGHVELLSGDWDGREALTRIAADVSTQSLLALIGLFEQSRQSVSDGEGQRLHGMPGWYIYITHEIAICLASVGMGGMYQVMRGSTWQFATTNGSSLNSKRTTIPRHRPLTRLPNPLIFQEKQFIQLPSSAIQHNI